MPFHLSDALSDQMASGEKYNLLALGMKTFFPGACSLVL